ncbi:MAG: Fe-S protein [Microbacterium sp.]|uniref:Fe-S protein n=1 Tax=Microbacterium aquimaris TaxID=459816 RepID=UPI000C9100D3|nr:Fe-S protein [Microbacterium aquimaris]MAP62393.1 Fe-S protein [Microbacterium sp.]MDZ8274605.1 Fe-S protein [Microbacterium aquimaris]|tara:strand:- start:23 stop:376 length:354 start_codon:yes stop_codon:yes gene_type:complete
MEFLRHLVVLVHLVGFALLFGAWAVEAFGGRRHITRLMNWGLAVAAVAGLALAAPWGTEGELNYAKIGVKLVILLVIGALLGIGSARQRKSGSAPSALFWSIGVLTLVNAGIAVLWT